MIRPASRPLGLLGQIFAILLLTVVIEFGASTLLYERAGRFSLREDEARRLAEHLVIAKRLVSERRWRDRPAIAEDVSTERYEIDWASSLPSPPPLAAELTEMRRQIETWEPALQRSDLRLRLTSPGRHATVSGGLRLADGSWLLFHAHALVHSWELAVGRILLALAPAVALLVIGGLLIRRALSPLRRLAAATERIGLGQEVMLEEAGTDEVRHVIRAFNTMQLRIHRLIDERTEALAAVGHDLRTPLARLQLRIEAVEGDAPRQAMAGDVREMTAMVASLLAFLGGEEDPETPEPIDLAALAATVADEAADMGQAVDYRGPDHLDAVLRPVALRRALTNLVDNALHYAGAATVVVERDGEAILLAVEDEGPGIPPERLEEALRPFTRLEAERGRNTLGMGLGLAIVAKAVEREGGRLTLVNRAEGGLRAEIRLQ